MAYVSNFKKFLKTEEKNNLGANPKLAEQETAAQDQGAQQPPQTPAIVDADPEVQAAAKAVNDIDSQIATLQVNRANAIAKLNAAKAGAAQRLAQA
jgi:hypothetical protein